MIKLSGLEVKDDQNPGGDIDIVEIGLRPGEKLYEELLISGEPASTSHSKIFSSREEWIEWETLAMKLSSLNRAIESADKSTLVDLLQELVPEYRSSTIWSDFELNALWKNWKLLIEWYKNPLETQSQLNLISCNWF